MRQSKKVPRPLIRVEFESSALVIIFFAGFYSQITVKTARLDQLLLTAGISKKCLSFSNFLLLTIEIKNKKIQIRCDTNLWKRYPPAHGLLA